MSSDRPTKRHAEPPPPADADAWLAIGTIVAPFGLRGLVKLMAETDFPERIADHPTLYLGPERRPVRLLSTKPHGPHILLALDGVPDLTAAERLRGLVVAIPASEAAPLAPDQYYLHDLIGLRCVRADGADLGVVADVFTHPAQDLLVVRRPATPDVLVPLVKVFVRQVDLATRTITLDPPAGLFADDEPEQG